MATAKVVTEARASLDADGVEALLNHVAARRGCTDSCCLGELPEAYQRAWPGHADARHAAELRAILDAPATPAVHAVAALWLSRALDVQDVSRLSRCLYSNEPAGVFPTVIVGQLAQRCYPVAWSEETLGAQCLEALSRITSERFQSAQDAQAWIETHGDPKNTVDYWQKTLGTTRPAPKSLVDQLRRHSPELLFRVVAQEPDVLSDDTWPIFDAVAKTNVGPERILRLLRREESFPELQVPAGYARFAATVLGRAVHIFEAKHAASLFALWEQKQCCEQDGLRAELAVGIVELVPYDDGQRMLLDALKESEHSQPRLLEALARRYPRRSIPVLSEWFYGDAAKQAGAADETAAAILRGLSQQHSKVILRWVIRKKAPNTNDARVVEALMSAAAVSGYEVPELCSGRLTKPLGKAETPESRKKSEAYYRALRVKCTQDALRWVRRPLRVL